MPLRTGAIIACTYSSGHPNALWYLAWSLADMPERVVIDVRLCPDRCREKEYGF